MLSLAKKKFDRILINANAGTPYPKNFNAAAVISTSLREKDLIDEMDIVDIQELYGKN